MEEPLKREKTHARLFLDEPMVDAAVEKIEKGMEKEKEDL